MGAYADKLKKKNEKRVEIIAASELQELIAAEVEKGIKAAIGDTGMLTTWADARYEPKTAAEGE